MPIKFPRSRGSLLGGAEGGGAEVPILFSWTRGDISE